MRIPKIYGFNKTSEAGNDKLNFSIFLKGCNLRCPYCINSKLVFGNDIKSIPFNFIKKAIIKDKPDMIIISGGEPLVTKNLITIVEKIKKLGCRVGMSTNGILNNELKDIVMLLDYVALDIKTTKPLIYDKITGIFKSLSTVLYSKEIIEKFCLDYEIRTTLYPPFIDENDIHIIGNLVGYNTKWILQQFRVSNNILKNDNVIPYSEDKIVEFLQIARKYTNNAKLRYI